MSNPQVIDEAAPLSNQCSVIEYAPFQHAQRPYDGRNGEEEEIRAERRKEGYVSSDISDPTSGSSDGGSTSGEERRRSRNDLSVGLHGWLRRERSRSREHAPVLAVNFLAEIHEGLRRGQRRIVRESVTFRADSENPNEEMAKIHRSLHRKQTVYAISRHDEPATHWHIVHACPWRYYCCRCYTPPGRRRTCRTTELDSATEPDWNRLLQYLSSDGRTLQYLSSGVTSYTRLRGIKYIPDDRLHGMSRWEKQMEISKEACESSSNIARNDPNPSNNEQCSQQNKKRPKPATKARYEDLESMIVRYACVPLQSITGTNIWQASEFRFIDASHTKFRDVVNCVRKQICNWRYQDFCRMYDEDPCECLWEAINVPFEDYYLSLPDSRDVLIQLLENQYFDYAAATNQTVSEAVGQFLKEVYEICEKVRPKQNALEIIGPAGSGKSYFVDCIAAFYINVGHARNFSKLENFPLQSCVNRRIILWNECQVEQSAHDTVKLLLGGDPCPANIKYLDVQTIPRTPVLITANRQYLPFNEPFNQRMIRYTWTPAPFLKDIKKKPHPLAYRCLLEEYNVIDS